MSREEQVLAAFWELFNKRNWLDSQEMKSRLGGYKPSEVHCIDYIGAQIDPNVTKLADAFHMTRSAISKLTKKMMEKGLIESYQKPENQKEIYFRLTEQGKAVNQVHAELHREYRERDSAVFGKMTQAQFESMLAFANRYSAHLDAEIEKLDLDCKSESYDRL